MLFVATINGDQELDIQTQMAASALRVKKADIEAALAELLKKFDAALVRLVRDRALLDAVDASLLTLSLRQREQLNKVQSKEWTAVRALFVDMFGEESFAHLDLDRLIDDRVVAILRTS
jgi:hypothetical protein